MVGLALALEPEPAAALAREQALVRGQAPGPELEPGWVPALALAQGAAAQVESAPERACLPVAALEQPER